MWLLIVLSVNVNVNFSAIFYRRLMSYVSSFVQFADGDSVSGHGLITISSVVVWFSFRLFFKCICLYCIVEEEADPSTRQTFSVQKIVCRINS